MRVVIINNNGEIIGSNSDLAELQKSWSQLQMFTVAEPNVICEHLFGAGPVPQRRPITENKKKNIK